jgi:hypothetical protein
MPNRRCVFSKRSMAELQETNLENYCERVRVGVLKYCHDVHFHTSPPLTHLHPMLSQSEESSSDDDPILSLLVGESLEWCKYEAFCFGFEEILNNERLYSQQSLELEELRRQHELLKSQHKESLEEISNLKKQLTTSEDEDKSPKNGRCGGRVNRLSWNVALGQNNKENRSRFPIIDLHEEI